MCVFINDQLDGTGGLSNNQETLDNIRNVLTVQMQHLLHLHCNMLLCKEYVTLVLIQILRYRNGSIMQWLILGGESNSFGVMFVKLNIQNYPSW